MDNLVFEKIWQDDNLLELRITANCDFVKAYQDCYVSTENLDQIAEEIIKYAEDYNKPCYLVFGNKEGNCTPAFSMLIFPADDYGHVKIEVDIEIADNDERCHRCTFYVNTEIGTVEQMGVRLKKFVNCNERGIVSLIEA